MEALLQPIAAFAERHLKGPLRFVGPTFALLIVIAATIYILAFVWRSFESDPEIVIAVLGLFFVVVLAGFLSAVNFRRAVKMLGQETPSADPSKRRKFSRWAVAIVVVLLVGMTSASAWVLYPRLLLFAAEMRLRYLPDPDLAYLRQLESDLAEGIVSDDTLKSLVGELFVVGPGDPIEREAISYDHDFDSAQMNETHEDADVGIQILRQVNVGGILVRPSSFAIFSTSEPESKTQTRRLVGLRLSTPESLREWIARLQRHRLQPDVAGEVTKSPLLIMADHEGGRADSLNDLSRLGVALAPELPAAMAVSATRQRANACRVGFLAGRDLRSLGINVNLGPVLDIAAEDYNQVIHDRSFGTDISTTTTMAAAYYDGLLLAGVTPVIKHFPGHSRTPAGAHMPRLETSDYDAAQLDALLEPFRQSLSSLDPQPPIAMSAFFSAPGLDLDNENIAASPKFATELLRSREPLDRRLRSGDFDSTRNILRVNDYEIPTLQFDGVLISDDLLIGSLLFRSSATLATTEVAARVGENAIALFDSGHDMLLIGDVRPSRPESVRRVGVRWSETVAPAYLTIAELRQVVDRLREHIFSEPARRAQYVEALRRIVRAKIQTIESERTASVYEPNNQIINGGSPRERVWNELWQNSFGYSFRGALQFPTRPEEATNTTVVGASGSAEVFRRTSPRVTMRRATNWPSTTGDDMARRQLYLASSPIGVELVDRLGDQVNLLPFGRRELESCLQQRPEDALVIQTSEAGELVAVEAPPGTDLTTPTITDRTERIYEDLDPQSAEHLRLRRACFQSAGNAIADALLQAQPQTIVFIVGDDRSYFATLFALTRMFTAQHETMRHDSALKPEVSADLLSRVLVIFDWQTLLTYNNNEFGTDGPYYEDGDAQILERVNIFYPFSGYQTRSRFAVDFLMDPRNAALISSNRRSRMPLETPGNDIPFSISDASRHESCRDILVRDNLLPRQ